jgi:ribosome-dependent ATPase
MNEAERCDRISLMHAGKVLAVGTPAALAEGRGAETLEDAFVSYLAEAGGAGTRSDVKRPPPPTPPRHSLRERGEGSLGASVPLPPRSDGEGSGVGGSSDYRSSATVQDGASAQDKVEPLITPKRFDPGRLWAYARREAMELLRDPIRLVFAFVGPLVLMLAFGYGISFDVENLSWAAFDQDQTPESRALLESFSGSRYFAERPPVGTTAEMEARFRSGELTLVVEVPPGFGRDLQNGRVPEAGVWIDGAMPFRGETTRSYVAGLALQYAKQRALETVGPNAAVSPVTIETRFRYNQSFKSVNAMVPSIIVLMLILIPAVMSAVAVVREIETGSIANFHSTPTSKVEFLVGKQLPYVAVSMVSFVLLVLLAVTVFGVPITGSLATLTLGTLLYCFATTGFGQLVSTFTRTQVAAVFATAILAVVPAVNFSGLLVPVSSLSGGARFLGLTFPAAWYQPISVGTFAKALGLSAVWPEMLVLALFAVAYLVAARTFLRKQEA